MDIWGFGRRNQLPRVGCEHLRCDLQGWKLIFRVRLGKEECAYNWQQTNVFLNKQKQITVLEHITEPNYTVWLGRFLLTQSLLSATNRYRRTNHSIDII